MEWMKWFSQILCVFSCLLLMTRQYYLVKSCLTITCLLLLLWTLKVNFEDFFVSHASELLDTYSTPRTIKFTFTCDIIPSCIKQNWITPLPTPCSDKCPFIYWKLGLNLFFLHLQMYCENWYYFTERFSEMGFDRGSN